MIRVHDGVARSAQAPTVDGPESRPADGRADHPMTGNRSVNQSRQAPPEGTDPIDAESPTLVERKSAHRYRVRFQKLNLLRFVSHNDLLRAWERLLRRTRLPLKFTEGFHSKPVISSPLSLALGATSEDEIIDFETTEDFEPITVGRLLQAEAIEGLSIVSTVRLTGRRGTSSVRAVEYRCTPTTHHLNESIATTRAKAFFAGESWVVERHAFGKPARQVDIRPFVETIVVDNSHVRFRLRVENGQTARPAEVLAMLGLSEGTNDASWAICRTRVELVQDERDS